MDNIDRFNQQTAAVFALLYETFPQRAAITPQHLLGIEADAIADPTAIPDEVYFLDATLTWLRDAGYIWADDPIHHGTRAVLTPKGLEVLRAVPSSVDASASIGEQIRDTLRNKGIEAASALIPRAFTMGYGLMQYGASQFG